MKTNITILLTLLAVAATPAWARPGRPGKPGAGSRPLPADVIAKYDTDGDGSLSIAEREAMRTAIETERAAARAEFIEKYDTDGDGVLSEAERATAKATQEAEKLAALKEKFTSLDTDASGGLSAAEWAAGAPDGAAPEAVAAAFDRKDSNGDDTISLEEFTAKPARANKRK